MKRTFLLVFPAIVLAACASQKTKPSPDPVPGSIASYSNDSKTLPVGAIPSAVIHDPVRNKDLEMSIEYPAKDGPYPVIIFSPQYGATNMSYVGLSAYWASHGYVVIKPRHADAGALVNPADQIPVIERGQGRESRENREGREGRESRGRQRPQNAGQPQQPAPFRANPAEEAWAKQTPADWQNRVADIRFIIDSLVALTAQFPEIKARVDTTKIGVAGHGYGAFTALLIGGMKTFNAAGVPTTYADPRVKAVAVLSAPGPGANGLTDKSYADLRIPVIFITGTQDFGAVESETPAWRRQAYELSPAGDKWFLSMNGVGAAAFTGRMSDVMPYQPPVTPDTYPGTRPGTPGTNPAYTPPPQDSRRNGGMSFGQQNLFNTIRTVALAFFDGYLKGLTGGRDYVGKLKDRGDAEVLSK